jgi:succinate dehydrogenase/fumarate reductase cytochrome b subunit
MKAQTVKDTESEQTNIITEESKRVIYRACQNALMIVAISIVVNLSIRLDFVVFRSDFGELSVTETLQLMMLAIASWSFFSLSKQVDHIKHAAILIAGFFSVLMIRELDYWMDMIHPGSWVFPALTVAALACAKAYQGGKGTVNEMAEILRSPHMKLLISSVVLLLVFSRLYGMGSFWRHVMDEGYVREVKIISEEGIELLCYSLIALSAFRTRQEITAKALDQEFD